MQDQSGCKINVPRDRSYGSGSIVQVELTGNPAAVDAAKRLIDELINEQDYGGGRSGGRGYGGGYSQGGYNGDSQMDKFTTVEVDNSMIGRIIGKGGCKIREMQDNSGAKINVPRDRSSNSLVAVEISGCDSAIDSAKQLIEEIVSESGEQF